MNDRELLELAAKAAGIEGGWGPVFKIGDDEVDVSDIWFLDAPETGSIWDPLTDDGDALRLALKLGLCIQPIPECDTVQVYQVHSFTGEPFNVHTAANGDIELRIIIVQAAAEIGRVMP